MKTKLMRVDNAFQKVLNNEKKKLARITGLPSTTFTNQIITKVISNKLSGQQTTFKVSKKKVIVE